MQRLDKVKFPDIGNFDGPVHHHIEVINGEIWHVIDIDENREYEIG